MTGLEWCWPAAEDVVRDWSELVSHPVGHPGPHASPAVGPDDDATIELQGNQGGPCGDLLTPGEPVVGEGLLAHPGKVLERSYGSHAVLSNSYCIWNDEVARERLFSNKPRTASHYKSLHCWLWWSGAEAAVYSRHSWESFNSLNLSPLTYNLHNTGKVLRKIL